MVCVNPFVSIISMRVSLSILFAFNAEWHHPALGMRLVSLRKQPEKLVGSPLGSVESSATGEADLLQPSSDDGPLRIYVPQPKTETVFGNCGADIAEHQRAWFVSMHVNKSAYGSTVCNENGGTWLWDTVHVLKFYFGLNEDSATLAAMLPDVANGAELSDSHNSALSEIADCCEEEALKCCSSCTTMVSFHRLRDAIREINVARDILCSEEAILRAEGALDDELERDWHAKWDTPTARGERCIDPADCERNRHHMGKPWCYIDSPSGDSDSLSWSRPWDYCMPSIGYMCTSSNLDCNATLTQPRCSSASDIDSCLAIAGCAFKDSQCVPIEFELFSSSKQFVPDGPSPDGPFGFRSNKTQWQDYYRRQLDLLLAQVVAGQRNHTDVIEACSRIPFEYCMPPCTRHGFGSNIAFGQINPWPSRFGYCSLHGHYLAKQSSEPWASEETNAAMETVRVGVSELGLKLLNIAPVAYSVMALNRLHPDDFFPRAFQEWFHGIVNPLQILGYDCIENVLKMIFSTLGQQVPRILDSFAVLHVVKGPLVEEAVFRGIVQTAVRFVAETLAHGIKQVTERLGILKGKFKDREALERHVFAATQLTTSLAFAYIHVLNGQENAVIQSVFCFWNGMALQLVHQKFGLAYSVLAHMVNNAIAETVGAVR